MASRRQEQMLLRLVARLLPEVPDDLEDDEEGCILGDCTQDLERQHTETFSVGRGAAMSGYMLPDEDEEEEHEGAAPDIEEGDMDLNVATGISSMSMIGMQSLLVHPSDFAESLMKVNHGIGMKHSVSNLVAREFLGAPPRSSAGWAWPPLCTSRLVYEFLSLVLLVTDAYSMPFAIAWQVEEESFWAAWGWVVRLFWTVDLFLSCITGYWDGKKELELRLWPVAQRYLRTSFGADFCIVLWDWASLVAPEVRILRIGRLVRFARFARLLRLVWHVQRIRKVLYIVKGLQLRREASLVLDISVAMLLMTWITHVFCCIWYSIGMDVEDSDTGTTWLTLGADANLKADSMYAYLTSLHWALTQMTPGSMEVTPKSSGERVYSILVLFLGLVLSTSLISTITAMMTQYRIALEASHKNLRDLENYLKQTRVSAALSRTIKNQVVTRLGDAQKLKAQDVTYLGLVSTSLREALWCQVCMGHLETHPFWSAWGRLDLHCLQCFCKAAMDSRSVSHGDVIFHERHHADTMYIVAAGELAYVPGPSAVECLLRLSEDSLRLQKGMWCAELALFVKWRHAGTMHTACSSELLRINMATWRVDGEDVSLGVAVLTGYVRSYIKHLNIHFEGRSDLPDMVDCGKVMSEMPHNIRLRMADPILDYLASGRYDDNQTWLTNPLTELQLKRPKNMGKLQEEVRCGRCDIGVADGELVRFVFVVALRIHRQDVHVEAALKSHVPRRSKVDAAASACVLAHLAALDRDGEVTKVGASLPGSKRREKESNQDALDRMVREDLGALAPLLAWHENFRKEVETFFRASPTYGIRTRYCRTTSMCMVDHSLEHITEPVPAMDLQEPTDERSWFCAGRRRRTVEDHEEPAVGFCAGRRQRGAEVREAQAKALEILGGLKEVVVLPTAARGFDVYAWLLPEELAALADETALPMLQRWAAELHTLSCWEIASAQV